MELYIVLGGCFVYFGNGGGEMIIVGVLVVNVGILDVIVDWIFVEFCDVMDFIIVVEICVGLL